MVDALERHPTVRLALHYTGPLLDWLRAERPEFIARLRVARRSRPGRDPGRRLLRAGPRVAAGARPDRPAAPDGRRGRGGCSGARPTGAWLAERVWEPDLPDVARRRAATPGRSSTTPTSGQPRSRRTTCGDRTPTEDQGRPITVFGTEQGLRYRIPLRTVEDVIDYLREHATEDGVARRDDGRRRREVRGVADDLGALLGRGRWVERFFTALEANADWLTTVTPIGWLAEHPPIGRVYVPTGSYAEMGEWALPPDESRGVRRRAARGEGRAIGRRRAGCAAASWRNFQVKYREVNDLHKQMLRDVREGRGDARRAGPRPRARPPLPGPVERLLLARSVRRRLHQPHAPRDPRAPHRGRGPRRSAAGTLESAETRRPRPRRRSTRSGSRPPGRW